MAICSKARRRRKKIRSRSRRKQHHLLHRFWIVLIVALLLAKGETRPTRVIKQNDTQLGTVVDLYNVAIFDTGNRPTGLFLLQAPPMAKVRLLVSLAFMIMVAMLARITIFQMLYKTGIKDRPINLLILFDQIITTFYRTVTMAGCILPLVIGDTLVTYTGRLGCQLYQLVGAFGVSQQTVGSFGIAAFRLAHIKGNAEFMNTHKWTISFLILFISILVNTAISFLYVLDTPVPSFSGDVCNGFDSDHLTILKDYQRSLDHNAAANGVDTHKFIASNFLLPFLFNLQILEAWIYITVFYHIYKHNKSMEMEGILGKHVIRQRNQKNAMTIAAEAYSFLCECCVILFLMLAKKEAFGIDGEDYVLFMFYIQFDFPICSSVQAVASSESRVLYIKNLKKLDFLGLSAKKEVQTDESENHSQARSQAN